MSYDKLGREELVALLNELLEHTELAQREQQGSLDEQTRLVHELRVYQVELEMQNRELRDAHLALEASRDRYVQLYDLAPVAYITLDESHTIRTLNYEAARLLGAKRAELIGRSFVEVACEEYPEPLGRLLSQASIAQSGASAEFALSIGGRRLYVQALARVHLASEGGPLEFRCALLDVTTRTQAESARDRAHGAERALHQRFEALDRINLAVSNILTTVERTSGEAVLGAVVEHMLFLFGARRAAIELTGEKPLSIERQSTHDGQVCRSSIELSVPLRLGERRLGRLAVTLTDAPGAIEDARRTLELLAERVALAIESARMNQVEAQERARLELVERIGVELAPCTGLASTESALVRALASFIPGFADAAMLFVRDEQRHRLLAAVHPDRRARRLMERLAQPIASRLAAFSAGHERPKLQHIEELDGGGRLGAVLGIGCTTIIQLEARKRPIGLLVLGYRERAALVQPSMYVAALQQFAERFAWAIDSATLTEQLRAAISSRELLLAAVSHDLRSPLNAILLTASSLAPRQPATERRRSGSQVALIQRSVARMGDLIEDLLTASSMDAGHFSVQPDAQSASQLLIEACALSEPQLQSKQLSLDQDFAADLPQVWADRPRVIQVLINLLGNAIKYTSKGGALTVSAQCTGAEVRISVRDTGIGISSEQAEHVFDRYWTGKARQGGVGLGLYISERIVAAHGGRIWVESAAGEGACFRFTLPLAAATTAALESTRRMESPQSAPRG